MNLNNVINSVPISMDIQLVGSVNRSDPAAETAQNVQEVSGNLDIIVQAAMIHSTSSKTADDLQTDHQYVVDNASNSLTPQMPSVINSFNTEDKAKNKAYPLTQASETIEQKPAGSDLEVSRGQGYICDFVHPATNKRCGRTFSSQANFNRHKKKHTRVKSLQCPICNKKFYWNSQLKKHKMRHTGESLPYCCKICNKTFHYVSDLIRHSRVHTGEKPYKCKTCGRGFRHSRNLTVHIRIHLKKKLYRCESCKKTFTQKNHLTTHKKIHVRKKRYKCQVCSMVFDNKGSLTRHKQIHSQLYTCEICGKRLSNKNNLKTHYITHIKDKPYTCNICPRGFTTKGSLQRHNKNLHAQ